VEDDELRVREARRRPRSPAADAAEKSVHTRTFIMAPLRCSPCAMAGPHRRLLLLAASLIVLDRN
jgi:hypothetical protein